MRYDNNILKGKFQIYFFYIWKKIRDAKMRTKLTVYLVMIAIVCCLTIGGVSYFSMRSALIENAQDSAISLLKQVGTRMDERIREFQDATYSLTRKENVAEILGSSEEDMNQWSHTLNQAVFSNNLILFSTLDKYSDFAVMESEDGDVYIYNRAGASEKINAINGGELLLQFRDEVSNTNPIKWVQDSERVYFVRNVTVMANNKVTKSVGTMIFAVSKSLFECGDDVSRYVPNENIVVAAKDAGCSCWI